MNEFSIGAGLRLCRSRRPFAGGALKGTDEN